MSLAKDNIARLSNYRGDNGGNRPYNVVDHMEDVIEFTVEAFEVSGAHGTQEAMKLNGKLLSDSEITSLFHWINHENTHIVKTETKDRTETVSMTTAIWIRTVESTKYQIWGNPSLAATFLLRFK